MPKDRLCVLGPTEPGELGPDPSREAVLQAFADTGVLATEASEACLGRLEVRRFRTSESIAALLEP